MAPRITWGMGEPQPNDHYNVPVDFRPAEPGWRVAVVFFDDADGSLITDDDGNPTYELTWFPLAGWQIEVCNRIAATGRCEGDGCGARAIVPVYWFDGELGAVADGHGPIGDGFASEWLVGPEQDAPLDKIERITRQRALGWGVPTPEETAVGGEH